MEVLPKLLTCASVPMLLLSCGGGGGDGGGGNNNSNSNLNIDVGGGSFSSGDIVSDIDVGQQLNFTFTNDGTSAVRLKPVLFAGVDDEDVRDFEIEFTSDFAVTTAGSPLNGALGGGAILGLDDFFFGGVVFFWFVFFWGAFFGLAAENEDHAAAACRAALELKDRLSAKFAAHPEVDFGINP